MIAGGLAEHGELARPGSEAEGLVSISRTSVVVRDNLSCELTPERGRTGFYSRSPSAFPEGCVLVVRTAVLDAFAATVSRDAVVTTTVEPDKPLATRERTSLLTIIAALCKHAEIDISKPTAAAVTIEAMIDDLGARVAARTIENHLKSIPDALERRGKISS